MKNMKSLNLTIFAIIMSLLYTAVSVFAAGDVVGSQAISISNPLGFLSELFTKDTAIVLFAALSISAFLVTALEWFGILKSTHYLRNMISFSFVGFFLIMITGGPAIIAGYGIVFFYGIGVLFLVGIGGAFLVKHYKQKKAWQTDKLETDLQKDSFNATQKVVVGMVDELRILRKDLPTERDLLNTHLVAMTKTQTPEAMKDMQLQVTQITERIKNKEAREHKILSVQEAMKKKFEKDAVDNIDTIIN